MFGKSNHRKRSDGILGIFRLFLSLIIMAVLGVGLLLAYRSFSGYDPLKLDPKSTVKSLMTSQGAYDFVTALLTFNPQLAAQRAREVLKDDTSTGGTALTSNTQNPQAGGTIEFKFAIIADSHKDTENLQKALIQAKNAGAKFIIGMGDLSDVGTIDELSNTKRQFDVLGLPYYVGAGDHDLWDARNKSIAPEQNFKDVFGTPYQSFSYDSARFLVIFDSDNYFGLDGVQLQFVDDELKKYQSNPSKLFFVIAPTPLYHPSSDHVMGKVTPKLKNQAEHLISIFKKAGVDEVFSADTHFFSRYKEPANNLPMTTVGAVTRDRNPQTPRFAIVDVYQNGGYNVEEVEVK